MTSSTAAVTYGHRGRSQPFTEADWSDPSDRAASSAYERSKMIGACSLGLAVARRRGATTGHGLSGCSAWSGARFRSFSLDRYRQEIDRRFAARTAPFLAGRWLMCETSPIY